MLPLAEALDRAGGELVIDVGEPLLASLPLPTEMGRADPLTASRDRGGVRAVPLRA